MARSKSWKLSMCRWNLAEFNVCCGYFSSSMPSVSLLLFSSFRFSNWSSAYSILKFRCLLENPGAILASGELNVWSEDMIEVRELSPMLGLMFLCSLLLIELILERAGGTCGPKFESLDSLDLLVNMSKTEDLQVLAVVESWLKADTLVLSGTTFAFFDPLNYNYRLGLRSFKGLF